MISPAGTITQTERGRGELRGQVLERGGALGALLLELGDRVGVDVEGDDPVAVAHQAARHVGAHPAQSDHPQLHGPNPTPPVPVQAPTRVAWRADGEAAAKSSDAAADVLTIFGISGDLAKKMTFRALYRLEARDKLDCPIVGVAIDDWDDEQLREHAREAIAATVEDPDEDVFARLADRLTYVQGDYADAGDLRARSARRSRARSGRSSTSRSPPRCSPRSSTASPTPASPRTPAS